MQEELIIQMKEKIASSIHVLKAYGQPEEAIFSMLLHMYNTADSTLMDAVSMLEYEADQALERHLEREQVFMDNLPF